MQAFFAGKTEIFFFFCAGCFPRRSGPVRAAFPAVRAAFRAHPYRAGHPRHEGHPAGAPVPPKKMQEIFPLFVTNRV